MGGRETDKIDKDMEKKEYGIESNWKREKRKIRDRNTGRGSDRAKE